MLAFAYTIAMLITLIAVTLRGRASERLALLIMFIGSVASIPASRLGWASPSIEMVAIDTSVMVALLCIALQSDRFWPLWATAFQAATAVMSLAKALDPRISSHIYSTMEFLWAYPVLGAINAGPVATVFCRRRASKAHPK